MRIDPAGWPFIGGSLILAIAALWFIGAGGAAIFVVLACFFLFFFRDPDRPITKDTDAVLSPADGRVMIAGAPAGQACPPGDWQQISIFLSPMDVHVNRLPVGGRVGDLNEFTEVTIDHHGQPIVMRQIVGVLARRIVCRIKQGDEVHAGDRFGVMKFGSRMDIFIPATAQVAVKVNDKVVGGVTVIARLAGRTAPPYTG
ncbi:MAG: phosphatidylserine decarboxylase family protein [Acidobacteria bacterium]|nr:MAG: phosphatidylserine decarboxylase family protein [Acidobacteriota bacterium]